MPKIHNKISNKTENLTNDIPACTYMIIKIKRAKQNGDKRINLYISALAVILMALLSTLCLTTTMFFTWFVEGAELPFFVSWAGIPLTLILWFFIKRSYYKISFNDESIRLYSFFPLASRTIQYSAIIKIIIDDKSTKRRIETIDEFFEIDNADKASLTYMCDQKSLNLIFRNVG